MINGIETCFFFLLVFRKTLQFTVVHLSIIHQLKIASKIHCTHLNPGLKRLDMNVDSSRSFLVSVSVP